MATDTRPATLPPPPADDANDAEWLTWLAEVQARTGESWAIGPRRAKALSRQTWRRR